MPRWKKVTLENQRNEFRQELGQPEQFAVRFRIKVHELGEGPCPCCDAPRGRLLEVKDDLQILVDRSRAPAHRIMSNQVMTPSGREEFNLRMEEAEPPLEDGTFRRGVMTGLLDCQVTCFDYAVDDLLDDETPVIYRSGFWQTGKTYQNLSWFARGLLKYGGRSELFWILAPQLDQSFECFTKLFDGSSGNPPILPKQLLVRWPKKKTEREQWALAIDDSRIEVRHGAGQGRGLEGKKVRRIMYDEPSSSPTDHAYHISKARTLLTKGQVGMSGVPKHECDWMYDQIVAPFEASELEGKKHDTIRVLYMDPRKNVFVPEGGLDRIVGKDPDAEMLEMLTGRWTRHGNKAYTDVWKPDLYLLDNESFDPEDWGFSYDVTQQVTRSLFGKKLDFIGGQDFNMYPWTTVIAKIFAHAPDNPDTWAIVIVDEQVTNQGVKDARQAAKMLMNRAEGRYDGNLGLVCDANGFHRANQQGGRRDQQTADALRFKELGFKVESPIRRAKRKTSGRSNPGIGDSRTVVRRLMAATQEGYTEGRGRFYVNEGNCPKTAMMLMRAPFGRKKPSEAGAWIDRNVYNLEDSMRYLIWRVFSRRIEKLSSRAKVVM